MRDDRILVFTSKPVIKFFLFSLQNSTQHGLFSDYDLSFIKVSTSCEDQPAPRNYLKYTLRVSWVKWPIFWWNKMSLNFGCVKYAPNPKLLIHRRQMLRDQFKALISLSGPIRTIFPKHNKKAICRLPARNDYVGWKPDKWKTCKIGLLKILFK